MTRCIQCGNNVLCKGLCKNCYQNKLYKNKINDSPLKQCECNCGIMIHSFDKKGRFQRYVYGHMNKGEKNGMWRCGKFITGEGYEKTKNRNHPFADAQGYVPTHRLVYEEYNKCCLLPYAEIDHINEDKLDNRIENLRPLYKRQHLLLHWSRKLQK